MFSSETDSNVTLKQGNLLDSTAHALVNTVNCVGVMGKGIALEFKRRYPGMFHDYQRRCDKRQVKLGRPYAFVADDHLIINFPTKDHWRAVSRLEDIERGLEYLREHLDEWRVKSIAVPPLGCGNGQLDWSIVGPTLYRHLSRFGIPVELYVPHEVEPSLAQLALFDSGDSDVKQDVHTGVAVEPGILALVEILHRIEREPFHWPVGRIIFQKLTYFATAAGIPTGLHFEAGSYGPYSADVKRVVGRLQNNGLVEERRYGRAFEVRVGGTFTDIQSSIADILGPWSHAIERVVDLVSRLDPGQVEIAASVHYVSVALGKNRGRTPTGTEVVDAVTKWKVRRKPAVRREDVERAVVQLATQRWIDVEPDASISEVAERLLAV